MRSLISISAEKSYCCVIIRLCREKDLIHFHLTFVNVISHTDIFYELFTAEEVLQVLMTFELNLTNRSLASIGLRSRLQENMLKLQQFTV